MNKHLLAKITLLGAAQLFTFNTAFADIPLTPAQFAKAKHKILIKSYSV